MKLKEGRITLLFSEEGLRVELIDRLSGITFVRVKLNQEQTCQAMSRLAHTHCDIEVFGLEVVGKCLEIKDLTFPIGNVDYYDRKKVAIEKALEFCPEGWVPDEYYGSKGSFYDKKDKDGNKITWARTHIRRWVDKEEE